MSTGSIQYDKIQYGRIQYGGRHAIFLMSVVFASVVINLFIKSGMDFSYLSLSFEQLEVMTGTTMISSIVYIFLKRIKHCLILFVLMRVLKPDFVYNAVVILLSGMLGVLLTVQTYYGGISGVFLLILYLIPHYFVYMMLVQYMYEHYTYTSNDTGKLKFLVTIMLLLGIGVLCEGFFSRFFLIKYYQYIVIS